MGFEALYQPIRLGPVEVKNRFSMAPTSAVQAETGLPTEQNYAYIAARAKGGAGIVHTGSVQGTPKAWIGQSEIQHPLYDPTHVGAYAELTDTAHAFGAKAFIQLSLGLGNRGYKADGSPGWAPSAIAKAELPGGMPDHEGFRTYFLRLPHSKAMVDGHAVVPPRAYTTEEIEEEIETYVASAKLAATAGFDGIEIHACHGYLLDQFRSPLTNIRTDKYGGSVENRNRIIVEISQKTVEAIETDFPEVAVGVRLSAEEHVEGGYQFVETRDLAVELAAVGVHYFDITSSSRASFKDFVPDIDGTNMKYAKGIKEATGLPVMCNNLHEPANYLKAIEEGYCDIVNMCRPLIADPDIPNKVRANKIDQIVRCTRCYACTLRLTVFIPVRCPLNPNVGRERYMPEYLRPPVWQTKEEMLPAQIRWDRGEGGTDAS